MARPRCRRAACARARPASTHPPGTLALRTLQQLAGHAVKPATHYLELGQQPERCRIRARTFRVAPCAVRRELVATAPKFPNPTALAQAAARTRRHLAARIRTRRKHSKPRPLATPAPHPRTAHPRDAQRTRAHPLRTRTAPRPRHTAHTRRLLARLGRHVHRHARAGNPSDSAAMRGRRRRRPQQHTRAQRAAGPARVRRSTPRRRPRRTRAPHMAPRPCTRHTRMRERRTTTRRRAHSTLHRDTPHGGVEPAKHSCPSHESPEPAHESRHPDDTRKHAQLRRRTRVAVPHDRHYRRRDGQRTCKPPRRYSVVHGRPRSAPHLPASRNTCRVRHSLLRTPHPVGDTRTVDARAAASCAPPRRDPVLQRARNRLRNVRTRVGRDPHTHIHTHAPHIRRCTPRTHPHNDVTPAAGAAGHSTRRRGALHRRAVQAARSRGHCHSIDMA